MRVYLCLPHVSVEVLISYNISHYNHQMQLNQLFSIFADPQKNTIPQFHVTSLHTNANEVEIGGVFIAIKGSKENGHNHIATAITRGAMALVVEDKSKIPVDFRGFSLVVNDTREALGQIASTFYSYPSRDLYTIGVTGTNGKTSLTYLVEWILNAARFPCAVMGTIDHHFQDRKWPAALTTPPPVELQKRLREFKDVGAQAVVMEVSSHALDQKRADHVAFNTVVFTNLTRDHLDYHKTMENYLRAKEKLFTELVQRSIKFPIYAIVNIGDKYGRRLKISDPALLLTYGHPEADFFHQIKKMSFAGTQFLLQAPFGEIEIEIPLIGEHNVLNAIAGALACVGAGVSLAQGLQSLKEFTGIPGRLQKVMGIEKNVFIDYAHTPDALENVLRTLSFIRQQQAIEKKQAKIICVFGCGGDRDQGKRPLMAAIAEKYSDKVVVTSDNPRSEDPLKIIADIRTGFKLSNYTEVADRKQAIALAMAEASAEDVVLIAGKGHEDYQIIGTEKYDFSDYRTAFEVGFN